MKSYFNELNEKELKTILRGKELNSYFDHTLLKADATEDQIRKLCYEAEKYKFYSVCINPCYIPLAYSILKSSSVKIATVVGFPLGAMSMESKSFEAKNALKAGADEIDMVINIGALKSSNWDYLREDISKAFSEVKKENGLLKIIIETCLLSDYEKVAICDIATSIGVDFVKTSTGFSSEGAKASDVKLIRENIGDSMKVKASGGIKTLYDALSMIEAGADRIGASAGVEIMTEYINLLK